MVWNVATRKAQANSFDAVAEATLHITVYLRMFMLYNIYFIDKKFFYSKISIIFVVSIVAVSRNIQFISLLRGGAATSKPY